MSPNLLPQLTASRLLALFAVTLVTACASYAPTPLTPQSIVRSQAVQAINPVVAQHELKSLAPAYVWDGERWDNLSLLAAALTTSPQAAQARTALAAAEASAGAARIAPGPTFTLTAEYVFDPAASSPWLVGAAGDTLLDIGGRRRGRIEAADIALKQAQLDYAASLWAIRMSVQQALIAKQYAHKETTLLENLFTLRKRQFAAMERRANAGEIAKPPYGYVAVAAEKRGDKVKKKLAIDPQAAETIKLIFKLFLEGNGESGPMGIKAIAT